MDHLLIYQLNLGKHDDKFLCTKIFNIFLFAYHVNILNHIRESLKTTENSLKYWARSLVVKRPVCNGRPRVRFSAGPFFLNGVDSTKINLI